MLFTWEMKWLDQELLGLSESVWEVALSIPVLFIDVRISS